MSVIADRMAAEKAAPVPSRRSGVAGLRLESKLVEGAEWDRVIAGFDDVCQEQMHVFAKRRWPGAVQEPRLFLLGGEVVGGAMVMVQPLPLRLGEIAVAKWAPMLKDASSPDADAIHAGMVDAMMVEYADRRGQMLSILPWASSTPVNTAYERLISRGFRRGSRLLFPNRYMVNLRLSDDEQRRSFDQAWRRQLNKAEKAGLVFEHATPEGIGAFEALYAAMSERKQFADHSAYETVPDLMDIEDPQLRPELFFVRHQGELVAGALIFKGGERAVYLYGATNDKALPLRAGYFLHWHIIRWLRDNTRARWYDLGGTDGFQGLHQFKKGMVGAAGVIRPVPPVANYASRPLAYMMGAGAFAGRDFVQHARRILGSWLNPRSRPTQSRGAPDEAAR